MKPFVGDGDQIALDNDFFRRVVHTGHHSQLVAMTLPPGEDIGFEVHEVDQLFVIIEGMARAELDAEVFSVGPRGVISVPAGTRHNIASTGVAPLRLLTLYSPAQHADGTIHETKADAMAAEEREAAVI